MSEDSSFRLLTLIIAWASGILLAAISLIRAVVASASATRLEELHAKHAELLDSIYDARRLSSVGRTVLMLLDVGSLTVFAVSLSTLITDDIADEWKRAMALASVATGIVVGKAAIHVLGDLVADMALLHVARWFRCLMRAALPLVWVSRVILDRLHARRHSGEEAREQVAEELTAIMEEAVEEGALEAGEARILQNIMRVRDVHVEDVMTPRNVVAGLPAEMTIADAARMPELQTYSRLPVWEGAAMDNIIGYVLSRDVLVSALGGNGDAAVRTLVRPVVFIPENVGLDRALEEFLKRRQHMFIVVDEYGGVEGLLTLEDVVETILGAEIVDEADRVVDMRQFAKQQRDRRIAQQQHVGQSEYHR